MEILASHASHATTIERTMGVGVPVPVQVRRPPADTRAYHHLRLANGVEALLISDPDAALCHVSVDVAVGFVHDPPQLDGLAHLLELYRMTRAS